ncbi:hypothetical protein [Pontiella sulfatireligans]|uniref:Uncharacterized protein n=1 Tax=Pontiella sulfatireligans TaxID=2750658 RepID=A0A6C2UPE5_9BACT|nr:hypothetical protein [Pontiella sulfatireligans]VGO21187.1 hypothetical protein SCARR_03258 [Pontiella sulfatireligans]
MPSQRKGCPVEQAEVMGGIAVSDAAFVFLEAGVVEPLVGAVSDVPAAAFEIEHLFRRQPGATGEQVDDQVVDGFGIFALISALREHRRGFCVGESDLPGCGRVDHASILGALLCKLTGGGNFVGFFFNGLGAEPAAGFPAKGAHELEPARPAPRLAQIPELSGYGGVGGEELAGDFLKPRFQ